MNCPCFCDHSSAQKPRVIEAITTSHSGAQGPSVSNKLAKT